MERIFDQAKDKNVAAIIVYGKGSDGKAYVDAAGTTQYKTSALKDAFLKRAIVQIGSDYFVPVSFTVATNIGTLTYAKAGSSAGTAATATLVAVAD
jgi:hypothetical protein